MPLLDVPSLYGYVVLVLIVAFQLPRLGHAVLAFLRDLDDYRMHRPRR